MKRSSIVLALLGALAPGLVAHADRLTATRAQPLVEVSHSVDVELVDGVKIHYDRGWVLLLPDPEEPVTHVWTEGETMAEAKSLAQEYARRVRQMQR